MMNPKVKQQWLTDLRSGVFRQGKNVLRMPDDRYCCLGVLGSRCPTGVWTTSDGGWRLMNETDETQDDQGCYLPYSIRVWAGLSKDEEGNLARMNDTGCSFGMIADYIEREL